MEKLRFYFISTEGISAMTLVVLLVLFFGPVFLGCATRETIKTANDLGSNDRVLKQNFAAVEKEIIQIILDGQPMEVSAWRKLTYAAKPVEVDLDKTILPPWLSHMPFDGGSWQQVSIFAPPHADSNSPIIFCVNNAGWMNSPLVDDVTAGQSYVSTNDSDKVGMALKKGYVVVSAGTRSRNLVDNRGKFIGKAPACVVDVKAAIRFLRLLDREIPGSAEHIIITGTSGGGALSSIVGASGNSPDYYPYLAEIGAAGITDDGRSTINDDVFGVLAYCPITDLGNADMAYEWMYGDSRTRVKGPSDNSPAMQAASKELAAQYPAYLAGLNIGLTAGILPDALTAVLTEQVEEVLAKEKAGTKIDPPLPDFGGEFSIKKAAFPGSGASEQIEKVRNDWLTIDRASGKVVKIDYQKFLDFVAVCEELKAVPTFDQTAVNGMGDAAMIGSPGESNLFGTEEQNYWHFTKFGWENDDVKNNGAGKDDTGLSWEQMLAQTDTAKQLKLINPLTYLGDTSNGRSAPYWYVRVGMRDRDTSFAVDMELYYALLSAPDIGKNNVDFKIVYLQGHAGDYDVQEAYAWVKRIAGR
jgi:hypothetical protein